MLSPRRLFFFEKWYFDAQCEDGTFVFLYFASLTLAGVRSGQFVISLVPQTGDSVLRSLSFKGRDITVAGDRSSVSLRGGSIRSVVAATGDVGVGIGIGIDAPPGFPGVELSAGDVNVRLSYFPTDAPWIPKDGGTLLRLGGRTLTWQVLIPCARVQGEVTVGGVSARFSGFGYHDFVQTDIPPWKIPLRDLLWGRALGENGALIWNRPLFRVGTKETACSRGWYRVGFNAPVECDAIDFRLTALRRHEVTGESYPGEMSFDFGGRDPLAGSPVRIGTAADSGAGPSRACLTVDLGKTRMFLGDSVADVTGFSNRAERWLYRKFTGDPVEYKLLSRVTSSGLFAGMLAAHERVLWGRGRA